MRIHLIKKETILNFIEFHAQSRAPLKDWLGKIKHADWELPADILKTFPSADLLGAGSNRVVFNIGGNNYRAIAHYLFGEKEVHLFICWIGTHAAYDRLCESNKQYFVNLY